MDNPTFKKSTEILAGGDIELKTISKRGEINLRDVKIGDILLSLNPITQKKYYSKVKSVSCFEPKHNKVWYVVNEKYKFAPHQSIYADNKLVHAKDLKINQKLTGINGAVTIKSIRKVRNKSEKIKIDLAETGLLSFLFRGKNPSTFFLNGILVHNADRYWVGNGGNWSDNTNHWAASSGGAPGASVPTSSDDVIFDANSGTGICTINALAYCASLDASASSLLTIAGTFQLDIYGSFTLKSGMIWSHSGKIYFKATAGTSTITTNGVSLGTYVYLEGVGGTVELGSDLTLSTNKQFYINYGTFNTNNFDLSIYIIQTNNSNARTINWGSSTIVVDSLWIRTTNLTVDWGTSLLSFSRNYATSHVLGGSGVLSLYDVEIPFANPNLRTTSLSGGHTARNFTITGNAAFGAETAIVSIQGAWTITGTLTIAGNSVARRIGLLSNVPGTARTVTAEAVSLTNADFADITAAGTASPFTGSSIGNALGNTNITFDASRDLYWVGGSGYWYDTAHWSLSTGGASGENPPLPQDNVFIDNDSHSDANFYVYSGGMVWLADLTITQDEYDLTWLQAGDNLRILGDITLSSKTTIATNAGMSLYGREVHTVTTNGVSWKAQLNIYAVTGSYTFTDNLTIVAYPLYLRSGTLTVQGDVSCTQLNVASGATINMGTGTWTLNGTYTVFDGSGTINSGSSTIIISNTTATAKTFRGKNKAYNNLEITGDNVTIQDSNTFNQLKLNNPNLPNGTKFTAGTTQTVTAFVATGSAGNLIVIQSSSAGVHAHLSKSSGIVSCDYLSVKDSYAGGGASWYAGNNSVDVSGNDGWIFAALSFSTSAGQILFENESKSTSAGLTILRKINQTILVSPADEASELSPITFVWEVPEDSDNQPIHAQIQIDKSSDAFEDLEIDKTSYIDSGFEYWDGAEWVTYPLSGVTSAYYGNQARITLSLTIGTKWWRVRGGAV